MCGGLTQYRDQVNLMKGDYNANAAKGIGGGGGNRKGEVNGMDGD